MNKGGKASASLTLDFVARMRRHGIVPELSFVLGCPPDPEQDVADRGSVERVPEAGQVAR